MDPTLRTRRRTTTIDRPAAMGIVNASPEPYSNVAVSTGEDVATVGLLSLAIAYPVVAAVIAGVLVALSLWLVIAARRALRRVFAAVKSTSRDEP